jgi:hypothetical protein
LFVPISSYYLRRPSIPDGFGRYKIKLCRSRLSKHSV